MDRLRHAAITIALAVVSRAALAEHDHSAPARATEEASHLTAAIGGVAASYRARLFEGSYQGATLATTWRRGRYEVAARGAAYQLERNGRQYRGFGDVMVHGAVTLLERDHFATGTHLMLMLPVGDDREGLGMGHWMVMPAAWAVWSSHGVALAGSVGYAQGIGDEGLHEEHGGGAWPLVEPMSFSELTYDATAMFELARELRAGARVLGALPIDDDVRAIGAARVSWHIDRFEATAEAQTGLAGDPVRFRGLVSVAMRF